MKTGTMKTPKPPRCSLVRLFVADDHPVLLQGVADILEREEDFTVCGTATTAEEALESAINLKPDVLITDLSFPGKGGLDLLKDLKSVAPDVATIAFSMHDERIFAERALRSGAKGYVMKSEAPERLFDAVRTVFHGDIYVSDEVSSLIVSSFAAGKSTEGKSPIRSLSDREFDVFHLVGEGRSTSEIATRLHLSPKTVESHKATIRRKLNIASSGDLLLYAMRWVEGRSA